MGVCMMCAWSSLLNMAFRVCGLLRLFISHMTITCNVCRLYVCVCGWAKSEHSLEKLYTEEEVKNLFSHRI